MAHRNRSPIPAADNKANDFDDIELVPGSLPAEADRNSFVEQVFEHQVIAVDGNVYDRCTFIDCRITFSGTEAVAFDNCTFIRCDWGFGGAALSTLSYLSALYRGLGANGQEMVEGIFDSIRLGLVESGELLAAPLPRR